ncbi:hypothetical protein VKT23_006310 [Stygiomarasmius scandens]|uniref:Uncharacterized protein n=1 Tax=Marasmiellus scandens TaxID=2682957 RepID=A0ABR1JRT4_9AGAR
MLILRVWHLFSSNKWIQYGMVICFIGSNIISLSYTIISAKNLELLLNTVYTLGTSGCKASRPKEFYRMFMPSLGLHTLLYVLTAIRALRDRHVFKHAPVLKRLLRDGGLFFFVVFGRYHNVTDRIRNNPIFPLATVGFTAVGSFLVQFPTINITIIYSNYLLSLTSIAMSRIMFSIHSLASNLGSSTNWLLSNVELSRVAWRQGRNKNEIIVERTYDDYDNCTTTGLGKGEEYEFPTLTLDISASAGRDLELAMERSRSKSPSTTIQMTRLTESRVGIYDDIRW